MSSDEKFVLDLLKIVMDPNAKDNALEALIEDAERAEAEAGLPPVEQRAKGEKEALLLLAKQDRGTTVKELEYYLNKYYNSEKIARLVARHPSIEVYWLAHFMHFLPEDAEANPSLEVYSQDERWEEKIRNMKPYEVAPSRWSSASLKGDKISPKTPWLYKVNYWLQYGSSADKRYVIGLEKLDEEIIEPFATDKSAHIRKEIARRSNLSSDLANKMSQDKAKTVRLALAENKKCPVDILVKLTKDQEEVVRTAALSNTSCPEDAIHAAKLTEAIKPVTPAIPLHKLTDKELIKLLGDSATESKTLASLAGFDQAYVKAGVALHLHCPTEVLRQLASDSDIMVRQSVGFNPNSPSDILQTFLDSVDESYHIALASNPSLNEQQQLQLVEISNDQCRKVLADTTELESVWCALRDSSPTEKQKGKAISWRKSLKILLNPNGKGCYGLQRGAKTRQLFVAKLIARHPKCPDSLKGYYAYYLFDSLAQNPNIALQLLENPNAVRTEEYADWKLEKWLTDGCSPGHVSNFYLHSDDIKRRRRAVDNWTACIRYVQPQVFYDDILMKKRIAERKGNTRFMFEILARDKKETVRELVAKNSECPAETLAVLAVDKVVAVKVAAIQNKNYKASLVKAGDGNGRKEEFKNKGPKRNRIRMATEAKLLEILRDLAGDKVDEVRLSVASNEKTPLDTLTLLAKDEYEEVRAKVGRHKNASIELLESLFNDSDPQVRLNALNSVNWRKCKNLETLPEDHDEYDYNNRLYDEATLAHFYDDEYENIQRVIARCTANTEVQQRISEANNEQICVALASNRRLDPNVAAQLIKAKKRSVLDSLICNTYDERIYIESLQADQTLADRLIRNDRMIEKTRIQTQLIAHQNAAVRESSIYYVKDAELLMLLARDKSESVRDQLCYNNNLTKQHVEALLETPTTEIVETLNNRHSKLLAPYVARLLENESEEMRAYIAQNFSMTAEWETKLRKDVSEQVRKSLANNWSGGISKETQELLKVDADEGVRTAVFENYS